MGAVVLRAAAFLSHGPVLHELALGLTAATTGESGSLSVPLILIGLFTALGGFMTGLAALITATKARRDDDEDRPRRRKRRRP